MEGNINASMSCSQSNQMTSKNWTNFCISHTVKINYFGPCFNDTLKCDNSRVIEPYCFEVSHLCVTLSGPPYWSSKVGRIFVKLVPKFELSPIFCEQEVRMKTSQKTEQKSTESDIIFFYFTSLFSHQTGVLLPWNKKIKLHEQICWVQS